MKELFTLARLLNTRIDKMVNNHLMCVNHLSKPYVYVLHSARKYKATVCFHDYDSFVSNTSTCEEFEYLILPVYVNGKEVFVKYCYINGNWEYLMTVTKITGRELRAIAENHSSEYPSIFRQMKDGRFTNTVVLSDENYDLISDITKNNYALKIITLSEYTEDFDLFVSEDWYSIVKGNYTWINNGPPNTSKHDHFLRDGNMFNVIKTTETVL